MKKGYVYILTNKNKTVLYIGVTSDIRQRILRHKEKFYPGSFTARYNCDRLMYFAEFSSIMDAIVEEKRLKGGSRAKKIKLIDEFNPEWKDLSDRWYG